MVEKILNKLESIYVHINKLFEEKGKILMFHHVTDEWVDTIECCKCKVPRFKEIISDVQKEYEIISLDSINDFHSRKFAIVTFDDGCLDMYENAYPFLKEHHIPFTVYCATDLLGKPGYISSTELKELARDPLVTIGYHTKTHPMLRKVSNLYEEMWLAKEPLEQMIGRKIIHFAFPYGKLPAVGLKAVFMGKKLSYVTIMSTFDTYLSSFSLRFNFFLPRTVIM